MCTTVKKILASQLVHTGTGNSFVQLMHPGAEPIITRVRPLNCPPNISKTHKRKFFQTVGIYLDAQGLIQHGKLNFWGEWELASVVQSIEAKWPFLGMPRYLHTPICSQNPQMNYSHRKKCSVSTEAEDDKKSCNDSSHSSDPFVFCEPFFVFPLPNKTWKSTRQPEAW